MNNSETSNLPDHELKHGWLQRAFDWFFGYDYFLAHRSVDGKAYAKALYQRLTEQSNSFDCFLDVKHYGAGKRHSAMQSRALKKTTRLIVIVTPHAHDDNANYLLGEIIDFKRLHPNGLIVPIGSIKTLSTAQFPDSQLLPLLPHLPDDICVLEPHDNFLLSNPTSETVDKLINDFNEERNATRRQRWIQRAAIWFAILSILSFSFALYAATKRSEAIVAAQEAQNRLSQVNWQLGQRSRGLPYAKSTISPITASWHMLQAASASIAAGNWSNHYHSVIAARFASKDLMATIVQDGVPKGVRESPDNKFLLTWTTEGKATIWNLSNLKMIGKPMAHDGGIEEAEFSPDGKWIATRGTANGLQIWNTSSQKSCLCILEAENAIFSPDSKYVLYCQRDREIVSLLDIASRKQVGNGIHHPEVTNAVFSPDGRRILSWGSDGTLRLRETSSENSFGIEMKHNLPRGTMNYIPEVNGGSFSHDSSLIISWCNSEGTVRLWRASDGNLLRTIEQPSKHVTGAAFSPKAKRILTWDEHQMNLWNAVDGHPLGRAMNHTSSILNASFSPDGQSIVAWDEGGDARIWDVAKCEPRKSTIRHDLVPNTGQLESVPDITMVQFSSDGQYVLSNGADSTARLWRAKDCEPASEPMRHLKSLSGTQFSGDCKRIYTWGPDGVRIWSVSDDLVQRLILSSSDKAQVNWDDLEDVPTEQLIKLANQSFNSKADLVQVQQIKVMSDHHHLLGWNADGQACIIGYESGRLKRRYIKLERDIYGIEFSNDCQKLIGWPWKEEREVILARLWNGDGEMIGLPMPHKDNLIGSLFSLDSRRVLTWTEGGILQLWSADNGQPIGKPMEHSPRDVKVSGARFSHDEQHILSWGFDCTAKLWSSTTCQTIRSPMKHEDSELGVLGAEFSTDGKHIMTWGDEGKIVVWDAFRNQESGEVFDNGGEVSGACLSPDGQMIFAWSNKSFPLAKLWQVSSHLLLGMVYITSPIQGASFTPDGAHIVARLTNRNRCELDLALSSPLDEIRLEFSVRSATALTPDGEVIVLCPREWNVRNQQLHEIHSNRSKMPKR